MKHLAFLSILFFLLSSCAKEEFTNARIAGSYNMFVKGQTDYWFGDLALNYTNDNEIDGYAAWDGENDPQEIRIEISSINKNKIEFDIPDQDYDGAYRISGSGVLIDNNVEFYYIIGSLNLSRSYVMSGQK